jgi:hypothetical protein
MALEIEAEAKLYDKDAFLCVIGHGCFDPLHPQPPFSPVCVEIIRGVCVWFGARVSLFRVIAAHISI